ncbi:MAG: dnaN [Gemmatimonadetes bacterium]|nr:dnaN [Gemmatimonadota bacterium]
MSAPTLTIARESLRGALTKIAGVIDATKKTLAVAAHVLLEVRGDELTLSATNFDAFVRVTVPCDSEGDATALVPAGRLTDIVGNLPSGVVTLCLGMRTTIKAGKSRFEVSGIAQSEMPPMPASRGTPTLVDARAFIAAAARCEPLASGEESRPALNTVHLEFADGALGVVSTNGHAFAMLPVGTASTSPASFSVHRSDVRRLAKLFGDHDGHLSITPDDARVRFASTGVVVDVRVVEAQFPPYRGVLSLTPTHTLIVDRVALLASVRRVSLVSPSAQEASVEAGRLLPPPRRVRFTITRDALALSAASQEGTGHDEIAVSSHLTAGSGESDASFAIEFNAALVLLCLNALTSNDVQLAVQYPNRPMHLTNPDAADASLTLVMPLRIV